MSQKCLRWGFLSIHDTLSIVVTLLGTGHGNTETKTQKNISIACMMSALFLSCRILFKVVTVGSRRRLVAQSVVVSTRTKKEVRSADVCVDDILGATGVALDAPNQQILIQADNTSDIYSCSSRDPFCDCQLVVNASHILLSVQASQLSDIGLPASSLVADYRFIYWIGSQDRVYYVDRRNPTSLLSINATGVQGIVSGTVSQQPLPGRVSLAASVVVSSVVSDCL